MKLRRLALLSLALLLVLSGLSFSCPSAKAEREWTPGNLSWNLSADGTLTITAMNPNAWNNYMNDFDSESPAPWLIDDNGQDVRGKIKKVVIGKGVRNCGEYAFEYCKNLTSVEMDADSVELIGCRAFGDCKKLTTVNFSANLEGIFTWAFERCSGLTSVTLPAALQTLETGAFADCSISSVNVTEGTETKTWGFFYPSDTTNRIVEIDLPASVRTVECGAFAWNPLPYLTPEVVIPSGTTVISDKTFEGSGVRYVWLTEDTTEIGSNAFYNCGSLKYVYVPWGCQKFGENCFSGHTAIVTISASDKLRDYAAAHGIKILELEDPNADND